MFPFLKKWKKKKAATFTPVSAAPIQPLKQTSAQPGQNSSAVTTDHFPEDKPWLWPMPAGVPANRCESHHRPEKPPVAISEPEEIISGYQIPINPDEDGQKTNRSRSALPRDFVRVDPYTETPNPDVVIDGSNDAHFEETGILCLDLSDKKESSESQ